MADKKITDLTGYTPAIDTDVMPIVDVTTDTTKKITWANIKATLKTYFDGVYVWVTGTPNNGDRISWNGTAWVPTSATNVVGNASTFYLDITSSIADNYTLSTSPSSYAQTINAKACTAGTSPVFFERFISGALGRTDIPAGTWTFNIYGACSSTTGNNVIQFRVNKRVVVNGITGTWTGAGATRTFTASSGTPFAGLTTTGIRISAPLIETPNQTGWVTVVNSDTVVTVNVTDSGYVNESGVSLNAIYYLLFNNTTPDMTATGVTKYTVTSVQGAFSGLGLTDRLVLALFGTTDGNRTLSLYYGGTVNYTNFISPLVTAHNDLAGLNVGEYIHMTSAQATVVGNTSGTNTGDNSPNTSSVAKSLYDANSILYATADDTPIALTVGASTIVGRKSTGDIVALTKAETLAILNVEDGADVTDAGNVGSSIHGSSPKTTMADADKIAIIDTEASNVLKTLTWAYVKSILKTYFDGLYLALAGGTVTGAITLGENASIALDPAGSADGKYTGITMTAVGGAVIAFGDLLYLDVATSRWKLADAGAVTTADRMLAMAVTSSTDGGAVTLLLQGNIRADSKFPALTIGSAVYVGETAGAIQVAIPTGADNVIRRVGYALTADEIYFNPSMDSQTTVA